MPDPDFAPFADLTGLLALAKQAEERLAIHFHPKHPLACRPSHLDSCVQTLWRLTAIRKTLIDLYRLARTPLPHLLAPPDPSPLLPTPFSSPPSTPSTTQSSQSTSSMPSISSTSSSTPHSALDSPPPTAPFPKRFNGSAAAADSASGLKPVACGLKPVASGLSSVPSCPTIPASRNLEASLATISAMLERIEVETDRVAASLIPSGPARARTPAAPPSPSRNSNGVSKCKLRASNFPQAQPPANASAFSALKNSSSISPALAAALAGGPDPP